MRVAFEPRLLGGGGIGHVNIFVEKHFSWYIHKPGKFPSQNHACLVHSRKHLWLEQREQKKGHQEVKLERRLKPGH